MFLMTIFLLMIFCLVRSSYDIESNVLCIFWKAIQTLVCKMMVLYGLILEILNDRGDSKINTLVLSVCIICEPRKAFTEYIFFSHA